MKKRHSACVLICSLSHQHADGKNECLKCDVIFCVPNEDAAFAQGCALSRAFPLYTRKGGVSQTPGDLAICASFWNAETNSGMDDARLLREITATAQVLCVGQCARGCGSLAHFQAIEAVSSWIAAACNHSVINMCIAAGCAGRAGGGAAGRHAVQRAAHNRLPGRGGCHGWFLVPNPLHFNELLFT
jgi:hypothetical protein